jgi:uncharacterized protein (TIGR03067 family)
MSIRHMLIAMTAATLASSSLLAADETLPPAEISGKWIATKLVLSGIECPPEHLADEPHYWTFNGDDWRYSFVIDGNRVVVRSKVALTDSEAVYLVDAKLWSGEARGKVVKGICSMDGETLRLCMADKPVIDRPTHFECPKGSELHLMELRRAEESPTSP